MKSNLRCHFPCGLALFCLFPKWWNDFKSFYLQKRWVYQCSRCNRVALVIDHSYYQPMEKFEFLDIRVVGECALTRHPMVCNDCYKADRKEPA